MTGFNAIALSVQTCMHFTFTQKLILTNFIAMTFLWALHNVHNALKATFLYGLNCGPWYSINVTDDTYEVYKAL